MLSRGICKLCPSDVPLTVALIFGTRAADKKGWPTTLTNPFGMRANLKRGEKSESSRGILQGWLHCTTHLFWLGGPLILRILVMVRENNRGVLQWNQPYKMPLPLSPMTESKWGTSCNGRKSLFSCWSPFVFGPHCEARRAALRSSPP